MIAAQHPAPVPDASPAIVRSVAMDDTSVSPGALVIAPRTPVVWTNVGRNRHTVTQSDGLFESGVLTPGTAFRVNAPSTPGVYAYFCRFHGYIRGTLTVSLLSLDAPGPVVVGTRPVLYGAVPDAGQGTPVRLERRVPGAWEEVGVALTDASGAFGLLAPPISARTAYRALAGESISPSIRADAHPRLTVRRTGARLRVRLVPAPSRATAHLERLDLDTYRWITVRVAPLAGGRTRFLLRVPGVYRAMVEARGGLSAAESRTVEFRPGAFRQ